MADVLSKTVARILASLGHLPALWHESAVVKALTSAAALGAVVAVLNLNAASRNGKKVTDYRRIARSLAAGERSGDHEEYDVVIVGGGKSVWSSVGMRLVASNV